MENLTKFSRTQTKQFNLMLVKELIENNTFRISSHLSNPERVEKFMTIIASRMPLPTPYMFEKNSSDGEVIECVTLLVDIYAAINKLLEIDPKMKAILANYQLNICIACESRANFTIEEFRAFLNS